MDVTRDTPRKIAQLEEMTLAMAQSFMTDAMKRSESTYKQVATRIGYFVLRPVRAMFDGGHDLTVKQFASVLAACGFEVRFTLVPRVRE